MSEYEIYFNEFCKSGAWVREDASECGCRGSGWFLSDLDTFHKCGVHNDGQPDPEYGTDEEWEAYAADKARRKYKAIAQAACSEYAWKGLTPAKFNELARREIAESGVMGDRKLAFDPAGWVEAAENVANAYHGD
jgi:hypothetical protein